MKMNWIKTKWFSGLVFSLIFIGLCWFYNYGTTFPQPPESVHVWRQTNSLSITQMYYQYNLNFFKTEIQNQLGDGGLSGKTAGEFPIIYFTIAKIWQTFGKAEWSFRLFQLLILFIGIFLLFRILTPITGNAVRAGFISMLVFTSPMFIFYGPNFLPDAPALSFTFATWYFLYQFTQKRKNYLLWFASIFIFLATSLKITTATSFIAIGAWILYETIFMKPDKRVFNFSFKHYFPFIICIVPIILWYLYIDYYNDLHKADYMFRGIWPIWKMTSEQFNRIIDILNKIYFKEFFWPPLQYVTILIWIFMLFKIKKIAPFYGFLLIVMPLGFAAILVLWFQVLDGHDYYMISQMQVLVVVWAVFFSYLKNIKLFNHPVCYILFVVIFGLLANNGMIRHKERYEGWMNENYKLHFEALTEIEPSFASWNVKPDDLVISLPDYAINTTLYYMNRKGYTEFGCDYLAEETFRKRIQQGAKYLVINDTTILQQPAIQKFATTFVGQYRNVKVFNLQDIAH